MSQTPNPFSDVPANPYQSPTFEAYAGPVVPFTREQARLRLLGPAIGLGISAMLWLMYMTMVVFTTIIDTFRLLRPPEFRGEPEKLGMIAVTLIAIVAITVPAVLMLMGAERMIRVRSYRWCMAGAIAGVVPCTIFFPLTLPLGIWGIVVLRDPRVRLAFS